MNVKSLIVVRDAEASTEVDDRTLAIVLGTVCGLLVFLLVVFAACYVARRWPWLTLSRRRARILRAEMALDGNNYYSTDDVRPSHTRRIFARRGEPRVQPSQPSSDPVQLPSAPEQSVIGMTELDTVQEPPILVLHDVLFCKF